MIRWLSPLFEYVGMPAAVCLPRIANGAGIASDPTLTDTWPCSFKPKFKGRRLGIRCFPFRSVRRLCFQFYHRRSHRHPDLPSTRPGVGRVTIKKTARLPSPAALQRAVPQPCLPLMAGGSNGHIAFRSEDLYTTPPSHILPGWPGSPRKTFALPSSTRLASGRSLQHEGLMKRADRSRCVFPVWNFRCLSSR